MGLVKDYKLYTQLSRALNNTFGTTGPGTARISTQDVNLIIYDEKLLNAKFQMIVSVGSMSVVEQMMQKYEKEGFAMIEASLKRAIDNYKEMFPDEKPIKFKINAASAHDDIEFINRNRYYPYSKFGPTLRGFYRLSCVVNISQ